jgi:hypothetical protein
MVSFTSLLLYPRKTAPGTYFIGGWVGAQARLNIMEKRKISCPYWESNLFSSIFNILWNLKAH